jgi:hypothetical protein
MSKLWLLADAEKSVGVMSRIRKVRTKREVIGRIRSEEAWWDHPVFPPRRRIETSKCGLRSRNTRDTFVNEDYGVDL